MGFCSGTDIFDETTEVILASSISQKQKFDIIKALIKALYGHDWDCEGESRYFREPLVYKAFLELRPNRQIPDDKEFMDKVNQISFEPKPARVVPLEEMFEDLMLLYRQEAYCNGDCCESTADEELNKFIAQYPNDAMRMVSEEIFKENADAWIMCDVIRDLAEVDDDSSLSERREIVLKCLSLKTNHMRYGAYKAVYKFAWDKKDDSVFDEAIKIAINNEEKSSLLQQIAQHALDKLLEKRITL